MLNTDLLAKLWHICIIFAFNKYIYKYCIFSTSLWSIVLIFQILNFSSIAHSLVDRTQGIYISAKLQFMVLGLQHSQTPALPDFETPALPDSETSRLPGSLRGSEAPGGYLMNMNMK